MPIRRSRRSPRQSRAELSDLQDIRVPDVPAALRMVAAVEWKDLEQEDWRELVEALIERIDLDGKVASVTWTAEAAALSRVLVSASV